VNATLGFLAEQPLVLIFALFAVGTATGSIRVVGVRIGPAAVLFSAIAITALGVSMGHKLSVPAEIGNLGLVLFTYTVGVLSGPSFFAALRSGARTIAGVVAMLAVAALTAVLLGRTLGLSGPTIAGTFAGALTNTPALAAAGERAGDAAAPTVGYSVSYLFGVIGMLAAAAVALNRRNRDDNGPRPLTSLTVRVERRDQPRVAEVTATHDVAISRLQHGEHSQLLVAAEDEPLRRDDLVTVVGASDVVDEVATELGHPSSHTLVGDRESLDFRRITLSRKELAGRTVADLDLHGRFGATVSRVRRADVDMVAHDELILLPGDRLRVVAPSKRMAEISAYLGDSIRGLADINPLGMALGMSAGLLLGDIKIPLPGGGFSLGAAAGTLLVGLVLGRLGRIGPVLTTMPYAAASAMSQFGMLAFLAYAGTKAGALFLPALRSGQAWRVALVGIVVTSIVAVAVLVAGRVLPGSGRSGDGVRLSGVIAGTQTQPAILAFANERTGFDSRVALGYALVYPAAMIVKIVLAQVLAGM
jgi:putative transport protein